MLLPPYLQNYARFLEPSLHPEPAPWLRFAHPEPSPWAVPFLVSAVGAKEAAAGAANRDAVQPVVAAVDAAIDQFLDDYCGTPPRAVPWPYPGPPPWVVGIASDLTAVAHTFQDGSFRQALLQMSARVLEKGLGSTATASKASGSTPHGG